jgi:6-phosphogluconolactonase (cycloisomerase 2 family)
MTLLDRGRLAVVAVLLGVASPLGATPRTLESLGALSLAPLTLGAAAGAVVSPDGAHLYVASAADAAVAAYSRDALTGALTFADLEEDGVGSVDGLAGAAAVAVSPDGAHVYVAGAGDSAIAAFLRDVPTGGLTFVEVERDGVGGVDGLAGASTIAVSPDGSHVYAGGQLDDAVAVFARNALTGALTFVEVQRDEVGGVDGLDGIVSLALSPDGAHLYTRSRDLVYGVAVFGRNAATGALTFLQSMLGAISTGVDGPNAIAVTPDGGNVYATSQALSGRVLGFGRNAGTGLLVGPTQYEASVGGPIVGLVGANSIVITPDGMLVVVASFDTLGFVNGAVFARDPSTGALVFVEEEAVLAGTLVITPDGAHLYTVGLPTLYRPGFAGCESGPLAGCRTAPKSALALNANGTLSWRWLQGETPPGELGGPTALTHYALCVYDESGPPALVLRALAPAGGANCNSGSGNEACWSETHDGFRYRDHFTSPEGLLQLKVRAGTAPKARMVARGRGDLLGVPVLPLGLPVRVQLETASGACWEATYATASANVSTRFKARVP